MNEVLEARRPGAAAVAEMQHCPPKLASRVSILHSVSETRRNHGRRPVNGHRSQTTTGRLEGAAMTTPNASPSAKGRRFKFTPQAIENIKEFVGQGISRDEIANRLGVTVGSLQVTCSKSRDVASRASTSM